MPKISHYTTHVLLAAFPRYAEDLKDTLDMLPFGADVAWAYTRADRQFTAVLTLSAESSGGRGETPAEALRAAMGLKDAPPESHGRRKLEH